MVRRPVAAERGAILMVSVILLLAAMVLGVGMLTSNRMSARMLYSRKERLKSYYAADGVMTWVAQEIVDGHAPLYVRFPEFRAARLGGAAPGSVAEAHDTLVVLGTGARIGGAGDECSFRYVRMAGEFDIAVMVDSLRGGRPDGRAGLMVREDTSAGARNLFWGLSTSAGAFLQYRDSTDGSTAVAQNRIELHGPLLVRLVRDKRAFVAYSGQHGIGWRAEDTLDVRMADEVLVGIAVASGESAAPCTAMVTNCTGWATVGTMKEIGDYDVRYRLTRRADGLYELRAESFRRQGGAAVGPGFTTALAEYVGEGDRRRVAVPDEVPGLAATQVQRPQRRWVETRF